MSILKETRKKLQKRNLFLHTINHDNYLLYCNKKVTEQRQQGRLGTERRKSSSDLSSSLSSSTKTQQVTDEPLSDPSRARSYKTDSLSSDIKSSSETLNQIGRSNKRELNQLSDKSQESGELTDSVSITLDENNEKLIVRIEKPSKQYFQSCLRRKSTSLDSFFVKEDNNDVEEDSSKLVKETTREQIVAKIKGFFSALKNKERSLWLRTRPVCTQYSNVAKSSPKTSKQPLKNRESSTTLLSIKSGSPVQSLKSNIELKPTQHANHLSVPKGRNEKNKYIYGVSPPSPAPPDSQHNPSSLKFYSLSGEESPNRASGGAARPRRVILKSSASGSSSIETNWESKKYKFETYTSNISNLDTNHLESQIGFVKESGVNGYEYTYKNSEQSLRKSHNNTNREINKRVEYRDIVNFGSEEYRHSKRYTVQNNSKRRSDNTKHEQNGKGQEPQRERFETLKRFHSDENSSYEKSLYRDSGRHNQQNPYIKQSKDYNNKENSYKSEVRNIKNNLDERSNHHYSETEYYKQKNKPSITQSGKGILNSELHKKSRCDQRSCTGTQRKQLELNSQNPVAAESNPREETYKRQEALKQKKNKRETEPSVQKYYSRPEQSPEQKPIRPNKLDTDTQNAFPNSFEKPNHLGYQLYLHSPAESEEFDSDTTISPEFFEIDFDDPRMGKMGSLEDHERKVIIEFCHLLEKSKQLFNGLRELPQYGHKQWHSYFGRTFDVYTKLWKFQQQHRSVLDTKYGLKRWQIGEIASKIGQLYYHFYLRTSETAYLNEAFSFYSAIRGRSYYTKACKEDKCELMVKKLRYYARFIVVCLLLKKVKLVRDLIKELDRQIIEYGNTYDPDDQMEWTVVVDEVKAFLLAEPVVSVIHPDNYPVIFSHRLTKLTTPPVERSTQMTLSLQEVIIVGSSTHQVKFSELTMDMFRMLQTLEKEPTGEIQQMYDDSPRQRFNLTPSVFYNKGYNLEAGAPHCENPHKYLLFKPTPNQILVYLASGCDDLPPNGALLVYMSAEGQIGTPSKHIEDGYDIGGLITTSKSDVHRESSKDQKSTQTKYRDGNSFHPGDLYPFTRCPLFVIIDSDNSYVFQNMPRHFGQPLVILMSPLETPPSLNVSTTDRKQNGNLFTLFLHSPLTAFCHCCDIQTLSLVHWDKAQASVDTFLAEASLIVTRSRIDSQFISFMGDSFLRLLILRYVFCEVVLRMHRAFRTRVQLPRSSPSIPDDVLEHPALTRIIMDLAGHLQVRPHFQDTPAATVSQSVD